MVGFDEIFAVEVFDIGTEFAVDEDSGGAVVEADAAGDESPESLGGDKGAFDDK